MGKQDHSRLLVVGVSLETDFLVARQRAKQIAGILGFENQDQTRIATAVSEIARNAFEYARGGTVAFYLDRTTRTSFRVVVRDQGRGIPRLEQIWDGSFRSSSGMGLGIIGSRRLMDDLQIESSAKGTVVTMVKHLPWGAAVPSTQGIAERLAAVAPEDVSKAAHTQNQEMLALLNELRERERELSQLNQELKETNRGVMVLYSELEDRALELQHASEMKTRFVSGVTHELRTPLNSIVSLAGLLIRRIDGELTQEQEKQVLFIQRSAQNLTEMVNDLLDLAKIEAGKVTVRSGEFTLGEFFSALRGMFRPLATSDSVNLVIDEGELASTRLCTDEGKLAQILRNFISNALKFTEHGSVRVRAESAPNDGIRLSVSDTGIGIAEENRELVWDEWGQVESAAKVRHKGSGLGLPLARQLATLLGGRTWLESEPGKGSTFFVELAKVVPAEAVSCYPEPMQHRILVVDDDEVARYILRRNLVTFTSAELKEAATLDEARQLVGEIRPSVMFLDVVMPDGNGLALAEELRGSAETAELPIVIVSSKTMTAADEELMQRHGLLYINKEQGDAQDQRVALERVLLNVGLSDLHRNEAAR